MRSKVSAVLGLGMLAASCLVYAEDQRNQPTVDFNRDIRPILSDNCFACHGPDPKQRKAGLRFDNREGAFAKSGVIVPGDSSNSRLFKRISAAEPEMRMPPVDSGRTLSAKQIELLRRWINEGAKWDTH